MNRFLLLLCLGISFQLPSNFSAVSASSSSSFDSSLSSSSSSTPATSSSSSVTPPVAAQHDDSFEPLHLVDGALNPVRLSSDESSAGKCEVPNSYRDFYIDISQEDKMHKNLVLRVTLDQFVDSDGAKTELLPDALKVLMYESSIPKDRKSRLFSDWSDDGTYSVALNARNLDADRYYVSIQCSSHLSTNSLPRAYSVHVSLSPSDLTPGAPPETGEICDHELVYHNVLVPSALLSSSLPDDGSVVPPDLAFTVCTPSDSSALISVSARMLEPPLRLAMPYKTVGPGDSCRTFTMCANELEEGVAWIGIFGRSSCTYYTVSAEFVTGEDECELEMGDQTESHRSVRPIKAGYSEMAYCEPNTWTDFVLEITNSNARANLVFEAVVNSDGAFNPSAISVHLFPNEISGDRVTEFRTESSSSNIYSVFKTYLSYLNLQNQQSGSLVYVGVRCGSDAQSFTLLAEEIPAKLTAGHVTRGEACPGSWIYHYIDVPNDALPATRLDVGVALFEGEIAFSVHLDEPPIRLLPPWAQADVSLGSDGKNVFVCNVEPGHRYYIGVVATSTCSVYDIVPTMTVEDECEIVRQEAFYHSMEAEEMRPNIPVMDSCGPNEYTRYKFNVKPENEHSNLLFLVELRREQHDTADDPKALEIFLYRGEIPEDYSTEYLADAGLVGQWSIAVNSHDVLIGDYFLAVKCSPYKSVRFSVVVVAMPSHLILNHRTHGEICKSEFAYFSFDLAEAIERASSRRVQAMLADTSTAKHLVVEVYRYSESFYAMTGHDLPPFKLIPPYTTVDHDNPTAELKFCDIKEGETNFVALLGAHGCSSFDVLAHIFEGPCEKQKPQAESEEMNVVGASEIFVEHFVRGSCEAKSVKDYYISIDDGLANDNYIFEVENLGPVGSDQGALKVCLFDGSIPLDRHSEICASSSSDGIVSVAISYLDIHAGNWFVSAQCTGDSAVSYRLVAHKITAELSVGKSTHGEVCYGEWVIHHLTLEPAVFAEYESQVVVNEDERRSINSAGTTGVHLRVEFVKYVGDFYSMTQAVYPPFKLSAPFSYLRRDDYSMAFNICDVGEGVTEFVGIYGGQTCSTYDIKIVPFTGDCKEPGHHVHSSTSKSARQLEANTGVFDSCDSHGWKDFYLDLDNEDMFESDFIFEVVLNSEFRSNPNALTMYLFEKEIPRNRKTSFVEFDADGHGVYSLALSTTRLKDLFAVGDKVFVSVRCGSLPVQFKILMFAKSPVLTLGSYQHFEICRDDWRDLFFDVPASFSIYQHRGGFVRFSVEKFEGDASFKAQEEERPLKMTYPFVEMRENDEKTTVDICDAEPGVRAYLAVRGGDVCAVLKVKVNFYTDDDIVGGGVDPCDEEANASHTLEANVVELVKDEFYYDSCEAGSYPMMTYSFKVTENERHDNLVFQLEQMLGDDRSDPSAVAFYGYYRDHVPELDREGSADMRSLEAKHNVHTLSLNYIDLHFGKNTQFSFAVRCGPHGGAKFNILAHQIRARMHVARRVISEVCPEKWIYHYIDTEETLVAGSFLRLRVRVLSGDVFRISVRTGFPPSFNTENDTDLTPAASLTKDKIYEYTIHVCDLKEGERIFIGLFGAKTGCAKYEVLPTILGGSKEGGCVNHHGDDHIYSQR